MMQSKLTQYLAWSIYTFILTLYGFSLWALFEQRDQNTLWSINETWLILKYSLWQAGLSALLSTLFGLLLARSLFYLNFNGKKQLYQWLSFAWALPSLVVIFAIMGVWGNAGWFNQLLKIIGIHWQFPLYGLQGILLAHLFFNIPLVARYCLEGLHLIDSNQPKLAAQLNITGWLYFRIVEYPMLKTILPYAFMNIFLVCFTSFPIVLMLGGGPKYSTLEVAIYQAVTFEFDFAKAVLLIIVQIIVGLLLQLLMDIATRFAFTQRSQILSVDVIWKPTLSKFSRCCHSIVLILISLSILLPMGWILWTGLTVPHLFEQLSYLPLWHAIGFSLLIALLSALFCVTISYLIALEARQLAYQHKKIMQSILSGVTTYPLILPVFMLAVGLFLLLMEIELSRWQLILLVALCNGIMLLPYIYRLIFTPMWQVLITYDKLARSLGLTGIHRWWIVERHYLLQPLSTAFALAMSASLGNFSIIAFFGSPDFSTLPYLLYQQLGNYRTEQANVTALVMMISAFIPFLFIQPKEIRYDKP